MSFQNRLKSIQQLIKQHSCDALLIEDPTNIFYLTGIEVSVGKVLVYSEGAYLIVDNRYYEMAQKQSPFPVLLDTPNFEQRLANLEYSFVNSLAFDSEKTSYKNFQQLQSISENIAKGIRKINLIPLDSPIRAVRAIKDTDEITILKEAANLGSQGFDFICTQIKEGITEHELATELEIFWKRKGAKKVAFDPIIAFGANSSMPHYRAGKAILQKGQTILIDIGVDYRHYHSDMTRMVFFGNPDARIKAIYSIVQQAQEKALASLKPGLLIGELDAIARNFIAEKGYGSNFTHSLGHGIGLEIHEFPILRNAAPYKDIPLVPGMVITIEPGIYLPGIGGVRIEDTVVITETGYSNLTQRSTEPIIVT